MPARAQRWLDRVGLGRPELRSWALYDWANSAFATTIMAAVLPIYYATVAAGELPGHVATAYWGYTAAIGLLLIALAAPVLGAVADYMRAKKRFLGAFMALGVLGTAALYFVGQGEWVLASSLFIVGQIGFTGSIIFADSLLPHIAGDDEVDRVSAAGYALGYVGGGLLLMLNLLMIERWQWFGFASQAAATRWTFLSVAVWWALFSIPLFRRVPESSESESGDATGSIERPRTNPLRVGFRRLAATLRRAREYRELFKFLVAYWFYIDGVGTIIKMATIYGTEIGLDQGALIGALLLVQFVGIPFTFAFGALGERIGAKRGIYLALLVYAGISVGGYFMREAWHFWALALAVAMVQGGVQALSRSVYATLIPPEKSSEFFSVYSIFAKFAGIVGPLIFALVAQLTGTSRLGILALVAFFIGGALLLSRVDIDAGRRAARREPETVPQRA